MGQTAQPCAARIERIDRAGFWRTIKKTLSLRARSGTGRDGAYYGGARQRWRSCVHLPPQPMFFLQVNGLAQTGMMTRAAALAAADRGHADRPDAVVVLMKLDRQTMRDIKIARLY